MSKLKVLSVASEIFPLIKTGGLADVAGALPGALSNENIEVATLAPGAARLASSTNAGSTSVPSAGHPAARASARIAPEPQHGSSSSPPGGPARLTIAAATVDRSAADRSAAGDPA